MSSIQRTLILLKPDALQRDLIGEILHRFERKGLKIVGLKMIQFGDALIDEHYAHHKEKSFFGELKAFMTHAPIVAVVFEGMNVVSEVRKVVGSTNPQEADAGTIRADFSMDISSNLIHASDSEETAQTEIKRFFQDNELHTYEKISDKYLFGR